MDMSTMLASTYCMYAHMYTALAFPFGAWFLGVTTRNVVGLRRHGEGGQNKKRVLMGLNSIEDRRLTFALQCDMCVCPYRVFQREAYTLQ